MNQNYRVSISPEAASDLAAIHSFVSRDSPENAADLIAQILLAVDSLAEVPHRTVYQSARGSSTAVRVLPVKPYMI
jgi:plasmid stabilization system protein ParE